MGFSPLEGLVMATRGGDLDPGLLLHLTRDQGMSQDALAHLLSHEAEAVAERMTRAVAFMLDAGDCEPGPTSVIDCTAQEPQIVRAGFRPLDLD